MAGPWDDYKDQQPQQSEESGKPWDDYKPKSKEVLDKEKKEKLKAITDSLGKDPMSLASSSDDTRSVISPQTALNMLPPAGGVVGGMLGAAAGAATSPVTGPVGPVVGEYAGAGLGSSAGEGLKYAGEKYLLGKDMSKEDLNNRLLTAGAAGVIGQGVGNAMSAAGKSFVNSGIKDVAPSLSRPGAEAIKAAGQALNVKPTQGMLTDDYTARNLENSLGQSPSIPGSWIRSEQEPVRDAIKNTVEGAVEDRSHLTDVEQGKSLRKGVGDYFENRAKPIQESYQEIESHTKNIPLDDKGLKRVAKNIRNIDEARFEGSEGNKIANQFADWLEDAKDVNDIKLLKTKAGHILRDANASFEAKSAASQVVDRLDRVQQNSITRQAVQLAREAPIDRTDSGKFLNSSQKAVADQEAEAEGNDIGRKLIGDIKNTNKQYRGLIKDAQTFGKGSGLTKANKGMSATLNDIAKASPEEMSTALFDQGNTEFMSFVKEKMPEQFELARQQKLEQIVHKTGGDTNKILKLTEKMPEEAKVLLFGSDNVSKLKNANTLQQAIPAKVGSSDTPRGLQFRDIISPTQNLVDLGRYGLLKGKKNLPKTGLLLQKYAPLGQGLVNKGLIDERQD